MAEPTTSYDRLVPGDLLWVRSGMAGTQGFRVGPGWRLFLGTNRAGVPLALFPDGDIDCLAQLCSSYVVVGRFDDAV